HDLVLIPREKGVAIGSNLYQVDRAGMSTEGQLLLARLQIPSFHRAIETAPDEGLAIGCKARCRWVPGPLQHGPLFPREHVQELNIAKSVSHSENLTIRTHRRRRVRSHVHRGQFFSQGRVPRSDSAIMTLGC